VGDEAAMKFLFFFWGAIGLFFDVFELIDLHMRSEIGVGTSAYASAVALIWIGGMIFFGLGALIGRKDDQPRDTERSTPPPIPSEAIRKSAEF
jgi:hypothetical protein